MSLIYAIVLPPCIPAAAAAAAILRSPFLEDAALLIKFQLKLGHVWTDHRSLWPIIMGCVHR